MEIDGGGWIVFQRRQDGSEDFFRVWNEYVSGFGDLNGEFWLGLEAIHRLAPTQYNRSMTTLRVDMRDSQGNPGNATYDTFGLLSSADSYELTVARYSSGNAGDSLTEYTGSPFYTRDVGHAQYGINCAAGLRGAWWFSTGGYIHNCFFNSHLNGLYTQLDNGYQNFGIQWRSFAGPDGLSYSEMKLRRRIQ